VKLSSEEETDSRCSLALGCGSYYKKGPDSPDQRPRWDETSNGIYRKKEPGKMTNEEMQSSIEAHDRQLDTVVGVLASVAERLDSLVRLAEIQNERISRFEGRQ
jgi:hypothetical protein